MGIYENEEFGVYNLEKVNACYQLLNDTWKYPRCHSEIYH